ncbi:TIGR00730 family Rossman fold protein [Patescibacteria group bacterium]|nr:TIGR00730 family Rossman fold protein [Patescibacteria group bacterium]
MATKKIKKNGTSVVSGNLKRYVQWLSEPGKTCPAVVTPQLFTDSPQWRVFRIMAEFIEGFEFLSKLKQEVSIFGSARVQETDEHYQEAKKLGYLLGTRGYAVLTGGGPGIMEAANRGAYEARGESIGLNIQLAHEQRTNPYVTKSIAFHYFFTRKVMLSASAQAYVYFPGGFGTMDEMTEMVTLVQTGKIPKEVPIILVGKDFWEPFVDWANRAMVVEHAFVTSEEVGILHVVDTAEEAMKIIQTTHERLFG